MFNPITPVEKFLDTAIDSGNIKWYLLGFIAVAIYLIFFN